MSKKYLIPIVVCVLALLTIAPFIYKDISLQIDAKNKAIEYEQLVSENTDTFYPGSTLNGVSIEGKTLEEVINEAEDEFNNQTLSLVNTRTTDNDEYSYKNLKNTFKGFEAYITDAFENRIFSLDEYKNGYTAPSLKYSLLNDVDFKKADFSSVKYFDEKRYVAPHNAYIEVNLENYTTKLIKEVEGNMVNRELVEEKMIDAIKNGEGCVTILPEDFLSPEIYSNDPSLNERTDLYTKVLNKTLDVAACGMTSSLDTEDIRNMLVFEDDELKIDEELLGKYVNSLKSKYDSYDCNYNFRTSKDSVVKLDNGNYGWRINKAKTIEAITEKIFENKSKSKAECVYDKRCETPADNLQGDTYIEVSLTHQKIWMYVDGELIAYGNVTTGDITDDPLNTVPGFFQIDQLKTDCILRGPDWNDFVHYWMRFDPEHAIGLHDATWRTEEEFGGDNRNGNGSHGCVNLPLDIATVIYNHIEMGMRVIVW